MPPRQYDNNCGYTLLTAVATTTIDPGATPSDPGRAGRFGVLYGFGVVALGTAGMVVDAYDVVYTPGGSSGTNTTSNHIMNGTTTAAGQVLQPAPQGLGVRYKGDLVVVTSGTAGTVTCLWD